MLFVNIKGTKKCVLSFNYLKLEMASLLLGNTKVFPTYLFNRKYHLTDELYIFSRFGLKSVPVGVLSIVNVIAKLAFSVWSAAVTALIIVE